MRGLSRGVSALGLALLVAGALLAMTSGASAHERRNVQSYTFVVGWLTEPAYINLPNAIDLRVSRTADTSAVAGLEQSLKVEVTQGSQKTEVQLRPRFNVPGGYDGRMLPTAEGVYSFRVFGTIEGNAVNETFTSGPSTFGSVETPQGFPNSVPLNQELEESVSGLEQRVVSLEADSGGSDTALLVGIAGVIIGALGLGAGAMALSKSS